MIQPKPDRRPEATDGGWLSRERAIALTLIIASAVTFYLCYRLIVPFLPAIAWALALAVMAHPLHRRIFHYVPFANIAAGLTVAVVAILVVAPAVFVTQNLVQEATKYAGKVQEDIASGRWRARLDQNRSLRRLIPWIEAQLHGQLEIPRLPAVPTSGRAASEESASVRATDNPEIPAASDLRNDSDPGRATGMDSGATGGGTQMDNGVDRRIEDDNEKMDRAAAQAASSVGQAAQIITGGVSTLVSSTVWFVMQMLITLMTLFFFFRDRHRALGVVRSIMPLSNEEADDVFRRVDDTIHATIFGSLVVALVQGTMGGLMFWWLGLPTPLLWGAVMSLLAIVPMLGTFIVWAPTAAYLAIRGDLTSALILASWGGIAIALIDNLLYPFLVGKRLRFHTLLVFFAILGGLSLFGASGLILGPVVLACADALVHVWRRRTAYGHTADGKTAVQG
ncbi:MAG: AI-2E family transporter [Pirellulaceae bacterium]